MKDLRTKILGLAAVASVFAGVSFGQTATCQFQNSGPVAPWQFVSILAGVQSTTSNGATPPVFTSTGNVASPASPLLVRGEGTTELVSDLVLTNCTSSNSTASAQVVAFLSQPITSKVINSNASANTEATLIVTATAVPATPTTLTTAPPSALVACPTGAVATGAACIYQGTVSGTTVTFTGVNFPSNFMLEIANIRVNASGSGATGAPVAVTESVFAGFNGQSTITVSAAVVGQALQSLSTPAFTTTTVNGIPLPVVNNHVICVGNAVSLGILPTTVSFSMNIGETLGGFFKAGVQSTLGAQVAPNTEYGEYVNNTTGAGVPTHGTRVQLVIAGVPSSATVYVPLTVSNNGATLTLTSSATGGFSAVTASTVATSQVVGGLTPSGGSVTAVYEVTTSNPATIQTFAVPVYVTFAANSATASQLTVLESYSPNGSTDIPNFAASTATPLNASAITACVTNLLFPFVTSQLGFDTGIAIANTTADPFGKFGAVPSGTTAPAGACTLNYYGTGAPSPAAVVTPSVASGGTYAFVNSSVAPGFQGYMIAQCPFIAGHGYAFVTNSGSAGNAGVAQGYVALSMPAANSSTTKRIFPTASTTEALAQ